MTTINAGDFRRAAALITQHTSRDDTGCNAVLQEAAEAGRVTELILGILDVYETLTPLLHSPLGIAALRNIIADLARREENEK
uniref:Uncharacterized protein n=1 Tax=Mycobacterium sp. (strain KMS) TaxID=189918 RepID=A1UHF9_MYCSK